MMPLITLSVIILLPVIPAFLLFRALPSTGTVKGTLFKGLEIKLGGAFAGYFVIVWLIFHNHDVIFPPPPPPATSVWHLHGRVVDAQGNPIEPLDMKDFVFAPPTFQSLPGGHFVLTIPTEPADGGGTKLPTLFISHGRFSGSVPLEASQLTKEKITSLGLVRKGQEITMDKIQLDAGPDYNPTGPQPVPLVGGVPPPSIPN